MIENENLLLVPMGVLAIGSMLCLFFGAFAPKSRSISGVALLSISLAFAAQAFVWKNGGGAGMMGLYEMGPMTTLLGLVFLALTGIAWGFCESFFDRDENRAELYALLLIAPIGMLMMAGAKNLLLLFLGVEMLSIPLYLLCAFRSRNNASVEAGLKYFLLGAFAAAFLLFGIALLYAASGSLQIDVVAAKLAAGGGDFISLGHLGVAMLMVGLLFKASLAPFHFWTPDVYDGAPTPIVALMAGGTKAAAFGAIWQTISLVPDSGKKWLAAASILTLLIGNLGALAQTSLKRLLAYSSVAHAGILLLAFVAGPSANANEAIAYYLASYGFTAAGAFGLVAWLEREHGETMTNLESYRGLAQRRPGVAALLALLMLSLGGIPPTAGFLAKYLVFATTIQAGWTWLAIVGILFSVISLAYYLRVIVLMYMTAAPSESPARSISASRAPAVAAFVCALAVLAFGVQPEILFRLIR